MLRELKIKDFAIVDSLSIEFQAGLNVLSGETGAGKSIIIGALELLLGARAQSDHIRSGRKSAEVQAFFEVDGSPVLEKLGIDPDDGVVIRRIISANGKGRAYLNDSLVNVKTLEEFGRDLVDIHGQHDHQSLTSRDRQLRFIDSFGRLDKLLEDYRNVYEELNTTEKELARLRNLAQERAHRTDLLKFQVDEITSADISPGEISSLEEERKILFHSTRLRELCEESYSLLYDSDSSVIDGLNRVVSNLESIAEYDSSAQEALELLNATSPLLSDCASALRDMRERYDADPDRLDAVEKRLDTLRTLQKKYGDTEEEILAYLERAREELDSLVHHDERVQELEERVESLRSEVAKKAAEITERRTAAAQEVQKLVSAQLSALAFEKAVFAVEVSQKKDGEGRPVFGPGGCDEVEFLFTANPSEPLRPLKKVASGGELSRVMLAIKSVFAEIDDVPVMVFDEIDAGIGGRTALSVGEALYGLARNHQILCITHLPQIASKADAHFCIEKHQKAKKVDVEVKLLEGADRVREIARMLSGDVTPTSLKHSEELLAR